MAATGSVKKVVLAYSGGLDTSIILKWLQTELGAEVVTFTADLGQGDELEPARARPRCWASRKSTSRMREEFISRFRLSDVPGQCAL
jgi:argininosuccinate synthase